MQFEIIDEKSPLLKPIVALGDQNAQYLGFFAEKAFERAASLSNIIAATERGCLMGYVLFYTAKSRVVLQHLCVDTAHRNKGVGRELVNELKRVTSDSTGILLHCDRTFLAYQQWIKQGFIPIGEKPGRGKKENTLTRFWLDYKQPNLITEAIERSIENRLRVVLDVNVFYDIHDLGDLPNPESKGLAAPWIKEDVACLLTDEVFTEIDRQSDANERKRRKEIARGYPQVPADEEATRTYASLLEEVLPGTKLNSDRRHLAMTAAANIEYFITRDGELLSHAARIAALCGVLPIEPTAFSLRLSELQREFDYEPIRLSGSDIKVKHLSENQIQDATDIFLSSVKGERKVEFSARLRQELSRPDLNHALVVMRGTEMVALLITAPEGEQDISVPVFRLVPSDLSGVIARNLLLHLVGLSCDRKGCVLRVTDPNCSATVIDAMPEIGFRRIGNIWIRIGLTGIWTADRLVEGLRQLQFGLSDALQYRNELCENMEKSLHGDAPAFEVARAERSIWPGKIDDQRLPSFIVPIQPKWAMHLFESRLANQTLFGARNLALNWEQAYYRASQPKVLQQPGRILWYVSADPKFHETSRICACSMLHEVFVGTAKEVHKRFRRLGVFDWKVVSAIADRSPNDTVMGCRFGMTELFQSPIPRPAMLAVLKRTIGSEPPLSTAVAIPSQVFLEFYQSGNSPGVVQ